MIEKLKNQLTAAVAMSAAALIASGYVITWARLANVDAPARAVLSALSTSYYLGVALESLLSLLVVLLVVGTGFIFAQGYQRTRLALRGWPSRGSWVSLGVVIALIGLFAASWPLSVLFAEHTHSGYFWTNLGLGALVVVLALAISSAGESLGLRGSTASAAAVLLLATVAAVGFQIVGAWLGPTPFPEAAAWVPKEDCVTPEAQTGHPGCGFVGFYVGEDSNWVYLVRTPQNCDGRPHFPPRLVLVPRDKMLDLAVSEKLRGTSSVCPRSTESGGDGGQESEGKAGEKGKAGEGEGGSKGEGGDQAGGESGGGGGGDGCADGPRHPPSVPFAESPQRSVGLVTAKQPCDSSS